MDLTITAEKVRAAAETCSETERALKVLFPEAFPKPSKSIDLKGLLVGGHSTGGPTIANAENTKDYLVIIYKPYNSDVAGIYLASEFQDRPIEWRIEPLGDAMMAFPSFKD